MAEPARRRAIGVMGAGACGAETARVAEEVGRQIAEAGAVLICGGRGGVMEAAARGARSAGGLTVGVMPGRDADESPPNPFIDVAIFTGMRDGRNWINACSSDGVIAISGGWGTLSEIALAMKLGKPVVLVGSWRLAHDDPSIGRPASAATPAEAVAMVLEALR